jgi:hypothetical protein
VDALQDKRVALAYKMLRAIDSAQCFRFNSAVLPN